MLHNFYLCGKNKHTHTLSYVYFFYSGRMIFVDVSPILNNFHLRGKKSDSQTDKYANKQHLKQDCQPKLDIIIKKERILFGDVQIFFPNSSQCLFVRKNKHTDKKTNKQTLKTKTVVVAKLELQAKSMAQKIVREKVEEHKQK